MAAWPIEGDMIAARPESAVHDALDPGAVQCDERGWPDGRTAGRTEQMPDSPQIAGSLLADGRGKQHRSARGHTCFGQRLCHGDHGRQAARVIRDARSLEARASARDGDVELRTKHGVEMRGQHDIFAV